MSATVRVGAFVTGARNGRPFQVTMPGGDARAFDGFECAIHALAPTCEHCGVRVIGHGAEAGGSFYCCAHCAGPREGVVGSYRRPSGTARCVEVQCLRCAARDRKVMGVDEPKALHVTEGEGEKLWVADELMTFKASGRDTGGAYALTDSVVPPGGGPPPHLHHREDEAFWVLEGELEVTVGEATFRAGAGSFVHLPKGLPHAFQNVGAGPARFLTLIVPAGLEGFFGEVGKPGSDVSSPPPFEEEDIEKLLAVAPKYGVEILPPPEQ